MKWSPLCGRRSAMSASGCDNAPLLVVLFRGTNLERANGPTCVKARNDEAGYGRFSPVAARTPP